MSIACCLPVVECVYCLACTRWVWQRCLHTTGYDSETWGLASSGEFEPVPRLCRFILAVYEDDLETPQWAPPGGYGIEPRWVVRRRTPEHAQGRAPTYLLYVDHRHADVVLAVRGMDMAKESDYAVLLDNRIGQAGFDGGYVHNGLLKAAEWVLDAECDALRDLLATNPGYTLTFAGHSLGSGVAAMLALLAVRDRERLGGVERRRIRCFAMAPPRCMSLNLAVRYADVINSVILQDDFLPRTDIPLEDIIKSLFCLPCLLCGNCLIATCIPESVMLRDPRRLYAPGRLYHIVERKPFSTMARGEHQDDDGDFMELPQQNRATGRTKDGDEKKKRYRNRVSQERLTILTEGFTDEQKGAASEMGMHALMDVRCKNLVNPVCDWLGEIYDPASREFVIPGRGRLPLDKESVFCTLGVPQGEIKVPYEVKKPCSPVCFLGWHPCRIRLCWQLRWRA